MIPQDVAFLTHWPDTLITIVTTVVLAVVARLLITVAIDRLVKSATARAQRHAESKPSRGEGGIDADALAKERNRQRMATLGSLLKSIATFTILVVALMTIMSALGVPMGPLVTSAGVLGVALGFGAQSLVKDFLSGLFMLAEDQYGVGDIIDLGTVRGTVEEVTLRVVRLRDMSGEVWYVPNGEIRQVGNLSQGWSTAMVDIPIAYDADPAKAIAVMRTVCEEIDTEDPWRAVLLEPPVVLGVDQVTGGAITIRTMLKTAPNQQWGVQRELRERGKMALQQAGIKGPLPQGNFG